MSENAIITVEPEVRLGSLTVLHPVDMIARASEIATALAKVIKDRKLSRVISGREYVYVDGWSTMGAMIGILPREVPDATRELENGDYTAAVELIRVSDGAVIGYGSAIVGFDESTWKNRPRYAKRSMAITRATGKAYRLGFSWIISLAGYATTPAEEMDGMDEGKATQQPPAPANGKPEPPAEMTIEQAEAEMSSTYHKPYGQIDTATLQTAKLGMKKAKNFTADHARKIKAIDVIVAARANGRLVITAPLDPEDNEREPDVFAESGEIPFDN